MILYVYRQSYSKYIKKDTAMIYDNLCTSLSRRFCIDKLYSLFLYRYEKGYYFDGEEHDFWEVVCVLDGEIEVSLDGKIYTVGKNQMMFHRPMQFHRLWAARGTSPLLFVATFSVKGDMDVDAEIFYLPDDGAEKIKELTKLAIKTFEFDDIFAVRAKEGAQSKLHIFANRFENFLISVYDNTSVSNNIVRSQKTEYFENAIAFLKDNIDKKLTVSAVADSLRMSESNLKKIFKDFTGTGVIDYFTRLKVSKAKQMLIGGMSSKECARLLGFDEQNYFSTVFKKETGMSPKNWLAYKNS